MERKYLHMLLAFLFWSTNSSCIDTPMFYRSTMFQGDAKWNINDWQTEVSGQYAHGTTKESWSCREVKTCLFNAHGPFDLRRLAENMECLDSYPLTKAYAEGSIPKLYDGKLAFKGDFSLEEYNIIVKQNLMHGLYVQAYVPIRNMEITGIDYVQTVSTKSERTTLASFVDNDLDAILDEHGIKPLKCPFKRTQMADPVLSIGWQGHCTLPDSVIKRLRGYVQAGIIIPHGSKKDIDRVFSLPTGYNKHWGVNMRGNIHATLWDKIVIGATGGTSVFFRQSYCQRVATSPCQSGWVLLEKRRATTDLGTIWDAGGYIKAERIFGSGLSARVGYSYTNQEHTTIDVLEHCYLDTALTQSLIHNKNEVANSNKLLEDWYQHVLHFSVDYDMGAHTKGPLAPKVQGSYDLPIAGNNAWTTDMWSGTFSLALNWCF